MKNLDQYTPADRTCSQCQEIKPLSAFSFRSTERRYESKCKVCRRMLRKRNSGTKNVGHDFGAAQTKPQPQKRATTPKRIIEPKVGMTNAQLEAIDFSELEKNGSEPMTSVEKHDLVQRFNEFVAILREGYSELRGVNVYIRKN